jgi:homoserine kinase
VTTFVEGPVGVSVPATSANLGPGFDSLGLALSMRDRLRAEVTVSGLEVEVTGAGSDDVPRDETHLVVRSMRAAFELMGAQPPGLRLSCTNAIPHARGLGSSSAAIVAGVVLARALVAGGALLADDDTLFQLAARIEGHPDNVAPALFGGFTISGRDEDGGFYAVGSPVDPRVQAVVFVPPTAVSTEVARGLLPTDVPHVDAAAAAGRTALLVAALAGQPEHLLRATRDYLHQQYRRPAMPQSLALVDRLREDGVPALVSGAGPTVLAFTDAAGAAGLQERCPDGWVGRRLEVETAGARLSS